MQIIKVIPTLQDIKSITSVKSILFDMDGTLVNTEPLHARALLDTLKEVSPAKEFSLEELHLLFNGKADDAVYDALQDHLTITFEAFLDIKNKFFLNGIAGSQRIVEIEIRNLLKDLKKNNYKIALVTASEKSTTFSLLEKEGLKEYFDLILTREDSAMTKPSPQPYLDAISILNIKKEDAFIFEDSKTGIQSAIASQIDYAIAKWFR